MRGAWRSREGRKREAAAVLVASKKGAKSTKAREEPRGPFLLGFRLFEPQFLPLGVRVSYKWNPITVSHLEQTQARLSCFSFLQTLCSRTPSINALLPGPRMDKYRLTSDPWPSAQSRPQMPDKHFCPLCLHLSIKRVKERVCVSVKSRGWGADLSSGPGSGCAPPRPPGDSGRSFSGSAGARRSRETRSVGADGIPPPGGRQGEGLQVGEGRAQLSSGFKA